jgi:hypothetical protein
MAISGQPSWTFVTPYQRVRRTRMMMPPMDDTALLSAVFSYRFGRGEASTAFKGPHLQAAGAALIVAEAFVCI